MGLEMRIARAEAAIVDDRKEYRGGFGGFGKGEGIFRRFYLTGRSAAAKVVVRLRSCGGIRNESVIVILTSE